MAHPNLTDSVDSERLAEEHAALRRVATLVARGASPAEVCETVAAEVARLLGSDFSLVGRYEADGTLTHVASHPLELLSQLGPRTVLDGDDLASIVQRSGKSTSINYDDAPGPVAALARELGVRCAVGAPIVVDDQVWGVMAAGWALPGKASSEAAERTAQFTELVATALANTESRNEITRLAEEQAALRRVATLAARELAPVEVLVAVAEETARALETEAVGMLRFEHDGSATLVAQSEPPWDPPPLGTRFTLEGENVVAWVRRTGRAVRMDDWANATGSVAAMAHVLGVSSAVATPIVVEGRLWGTMIAATSQSEPLPPDTETRIGEFTELVATAIANAESREALGRLADEQAALRRVAMLVGQDVPPSAIFSAVSEEVARVFDSGAGVLKFDHASAVVFVGAAGFEIPIGTRWEFQEGMTSAEVYRTGRSARVEEVDWSSVGGPLGEASRRLGTVSTVSSPIVVESRLWGAMTVSSRSDVLPLDTEERLDKFTELIATAIAKAETSRARAQLAEEQAALRRVATLVAEGVPAAELFSAVTKEVAHVFSDVDTSLIASVIRFDPGPESVLVGASRAYEREPIGSRWAPKDLYVSTRVLRTGRAARVNDADLESLGGPDADVLRLRGFFHQVGNPVMVEGRLWGAMTLNSKVVLPPDIDQRLMSFTELVATAIANAESRGELAASRARIVATADATRRRIERDLHDGAQQQLVSLALELRAAQAALPSELSELRAELSRVIEGLAAVLDELREISSGIHPAILSEGGLGPALRTLARRSPIPVQLVVRVEGRLPESVEVAAYYVVAEVLTNAAKHAHASSIHVEVAGADGVLSVAVRDDGVGGADPARGSGLVGLRDRVEALGGTITVYSPRNAGTAIDVALPFDRKAEASERPQKTPTTPADATG